MCVFKISMRLSKHEKLDFQVSAKDFKEMDGKLVLEANGVMVPATATPKKAPKKEQPAASEGEASGTPESSKPEPPPAEEPAKPTPAPTPAPIEMPKPVTTP